MSSLDFQRQFPSAHATASQGLQMLLPHYHGGVDFGFVSACTQRKLTKSASPNLSTSLATSVREAKLPMLDQMQTQHQSVSPPANVASHLPTHHQNFMSQDHQRRLAKNPKSTLSEIKHCVLGTRGEV